MPHAPGGLGGGFKTYRSARRLEMAGATLLGVLAASGAGLVAIGAAAVMYVIEDAIWTAGEKVLTDVYTAMVQAATPSTRAELEDQYMKYCLQHAQLSVRFPNVLHKKSIEEYAFEAYGIDASVLK